ncbi:hypothetical protein ACTFIR_004542 [Dictyostelium discoideum]
MFNKLLYLYFLLALYFNHIQCLEKYASKFYRPPTALHRQTGYPWVCKRYLDDTKEVVQKECKHPGIYLIFVNSPYSYDGIHPPLVTDLMTQTSVERKPSPVHQESELERNILI